MVSYTHQYVTRADALPAIAQEVASVPVLAEDLETTGFSPIKDKPRLWSINTGKNTYVIDLFKTGRPDSIIQAHKDNPTAIIAGQSLKFDQKFVLYHYSLEFARVFDSHRASQILHNGRHVGHDLYELYNRELGIGPEAPDLGGSDWTGELTQDQRNYAAEDVTFIPRLRDVLKVKLQAANLNRIAAIEFGAILPEAAIELNGFYLNPKKFRELMNEIKIKHDVLQQVLWKKLPNPSKQMMLPGMMNQWNIDSNEQMLASLRKVGVTQILKEKDEESGRIKSRQVELQNTSELTLAMVAAEYPIIKEILAYRETATQLKMFPLGREGDPGYLKWVDSATGRIHPTYWPFLTSGRYSCLPTSSIVATNKGLVPLGSVAVGDLIQTPSGPKPVTDYRATGNKSVFRFELQHRRELTCTGEHRVLCNGRWIEASKVVVGDDLYVSGATAPDVSGYVVLKASDPDARVRNEITYPTVLDERLAFVLGHYIAEGCIGYKRQRARNRPTKNTAHLATGDLTASSVIVAFGHEESALRDELNAEYQRLFDSSGHKVDGSSPALCFSRMALAQWFLDQDCGGYSREKKVPPSIFKSPLSVRASFLRGLFEGDGCAASGYPSLSTDSPYLAEDVGVLLASLGLLYSTNKTTRPSGVTKYCVYVLSQSAALLKQFPLFHSDRKLDLLLDGGSEKGRSFNGIVKPAWLDMQSVYARLKLKYDWHGPGQIQGRSWNICSAKVKRITRPMLEWLYPILDSGSETDTFLRYCYDSNLQSVRVRGITAQAATAVCDIEVEDAHSFLVNGVVVHNCAGPNIAQIPRDKRFRDCFEAEEGNVLCITDYSNVEMRIVAEVSGDPVLIKVFRDGEDAHYYTAMLLTGKTKDKITKPERQQAKPVNFGFIYGMMPDKLVIYALSSYGVHMTFQEAVAFRRKYFERFSGLARWHARAQRDGQKQHEARSIWGRRRFLDGDFYNEYYNHPIQSTGADGLKRGLRCVYERLKKLIGRPPCRTLDCPDPDVKMCHHVHDEIVAESRDNPELVEQVKKEVSAGMVEGIQPMLPHVPVLAEPAHGKTWADK